MRAAILLSGGLDSSALCYWKRPDVAITIDYGQLASAGEIRAASQIAKELGIAHEILTVDCRGLGSGDMAGTPANTVAPVPEWWPFRNQLILTIAAMRGIALDVGEILCGTVASDGVHADGRHEFFEAMDALTSMQEGGIRVRVPAIQMSTAELVRASGIDITLLAWSHSCHKGAFACGNCRGCFKHQAVMAELGYGAY